jgi:Fe-S-cluster containining protein
MCCRYTAIEIPAPTTLEEVDNCRWYLLHRNVCLFVDRTSKWFLEFRSVCEALGPDGRCQCYETRPRVCREYAEHPDTVCEYHADRPPHLLRFVDAGSFERYVAEHMQVVEEG